MSSDLSDRPGATVRLLDTVLGLIVWAGHLLVIYVAEAMYCAFMPRGTPDEASTTVGLALLGVTALALALIGLHAARHLTVPRGDAEQPFLSTLALAIDGVAAFGVAAQVIPIMMTPLCV